MAWVPSNIRSEMQAIAKLLQARPGVQELEQKLCASLLKKLVLMPPISSADLVMCYESLKEANLPDKMNHDVLKALDNLATTDTHNNIVGKLASSGQDCKYFHKYLTQKDNADLQTCSMWEGCLVISKRLKLLGICGMKESLKKVCLGILVWHEMQRCKAQAPSVRAVYSLGHDLVNSLRNLALEVPAQATCLACYPDDPDQLPKDHFMASYQNEQPEKKNYPQLAFIIQKHVKVRNSASELADEL